MFIGLKIDDFTVNFVLVIDLPAQSAMHDINIIIFFVYHKIIFIIYVEKNN